MASLITLSQTLELPSLWWEGMEGRGSFGNFQMSSLRASEGSDKEIWFNRGAISSTDLGAIEDVSGQEKSMNGI